MGDRRLRALLLAAATQTPADTADLGARLASGCWPGGGDRHDRVAREWLRRWAPVRMNAPAADCTCAAGRCCAWCG